MDGTDATEGRVRKLSLAVVLLAAGRDGVLVPLPLDTRWKERHPTGAVVPLGSRRWMVDLDADENARGSAIWLTSLPVDEVAAALALYREAVGAFPSALCLVGSPDSIPMAIVGDARPLDCDLVSDLPYGQTDDDPFVELAFTHLPAEDCFAATRHVSRGFVYDDLRDGTWDRSFTIVEWEWTLADLLADAGLTQVGHHPGSPALAPDSPLAEVAVLDHGSHAAWTCLGGFYASDSAVLVAPCIVGSSGCSTAALDQDTAHRSVAERLLRNGAAAFLGNLRRGAAQQELLQSEFWNALLSGHTLGEANRYALNRALVAVLEKGERSAGISRYQLYSAAVYGDPAWSLASILATTARVHPARTELRGLKATV